MRRTPTDADCGPRALAIICDKLGVRTDLASLTRAAGIDSKGASMEGLAAAAKSVGLVVEGVQTGRDALPTLQLPAVAWWQGNHYVALLALSGKGDAGTATIHDPNKIYEETISQEAFLRKSAGYLLLVHK